MSVERFFNEARLSKNLALYDHMVPPEKWLRRGFEEALTAASWSKDPNRTVGAAIMNAEKRFTKGFNGFPKHIMDAPELLNDRERKRTLVIHAEVNCLDNASQTENGVMFVTAPCCHECAKEIVNRGIIAVHALKKDEGDFPTYDESFRIARETFGLAGVLYREYERSFIC